MQIPLLRPILDSGVVAATATQALGEMMLGVTAPNPDTSDPRLMTRINRETHVGIRDTAVVEGIRSIVLTEGGRVRGHGLLPIAATAVEMTVIAIRKDEGHGHEKSL